MHTSLEAGAYRVRREDARHMVPSPRVGEGQGEGWPQSTEDEAPPNWKTANGRWAGLIRSWIRPKTSAAVPSPCPSPTRGEGTLWHCSAHLPVTHPRPAPEMRAMP